MEVVEDPAHKAGRNDQPWVAQRQVTQEVNITKMLIMKIQAGDSSPKCIDIMS